MREAVAEISPIEAGHNNQMAPEEHITYCIPGRYIYECQ